MHSGERLPKRREFQKRPHLTLLQNSNLQESLKGLATKESRYQPQRLTPPVSSLVALSFLNSFLF